MDIKGINSNADYKSDNVNVDGEVNIPPVRGLTKNEAADSTGRSWSN